MENNLTFLFVVAVALIDGDGRVLMHKRPDGTIHGGLWEFPGGKVEPGETPENAAVREMEEELGVSLRAEDLQPATFASGPRTGAQADGSLVILLYSCRRWNGTPRALEGSEAGWFAPEDIHRLAMPPLDYPLAHGLRAMA